MPRYINDDAPVTPNIRVSTRISKDTLKQMMIAQYNQMNSITQNGISFDPSLYADEESEIDDMMAILAYEHTQISKDLSNIDFDLENLTAVPRNGNIYPGDTGKHLVGMHTLPNGLTFCGAIAGGDWEEPLFFIIYHDHTLNSLRAYIPIKGNIVNCDTLTAFGSEVNLSNPNAPYNLMQLYSIYQQKNLLVPPTATLNEFIDDSSIIGNSYLKQYGGLQFCHVNPSGVTPVNSCGYNWDAIKEELETAISIV